MIQVRRLGPADIDAIAELTGHAFGGTDPTTASALQRAASMACPFMPPTLCWGMEKDGRLIAKWQLLDLTMRIGQARLRVAGAHTVAVHRDHQGEQRIEELFRRGRSEGEELGFELILGFAQRGSLYQQLGAVPVCADYTWSCDALKLPTGSLAGFHERSEPSELVRLYNLAHESRPLSLVRSVELWPWLLRKPPRILVGPGGYLGLREAPDALEVRELGHGHPAFAESALRALSTLARERGIRRIHGHLPPDHPLVRASIPYGAELTQRHEKRAGAMGGIVHVGRFLDRMAPELERRLAHSEHAGDSLVLDLTIDGRPHTLELGAGGVRTKTLRLDLPAALLLQLTVGYRSPLSLLSALSHDASSSDAARLLGDRASMSLLDALFPPAHPFVSHTDRW